MKHTTREVDLNNGAKALLIHAPGVEVVHMVAEFHAGFDFSEHSKYELPHVMEHMMFTNSSYPKPRAFLREVEKNGAFNNAYTNGSSLEYDYECAAFEAERIARLLAVQLSEPTFPEAELKTELGNVTEELNNYLSNPGQSAGDNLRTAMTGEPAMAVRRDQLPTITSADLQVHYKKTHRAANLRYILAGDIDFTPILKILDVALPRGKRLKLPRLPTRHQNQPIIELRDIPQIYYSLSSVISRPYTYRELIAARIIANILANGFSSTLLGKARERGLVYGLSMSIGSDQFDTGWHVGGAVSPAHAADYFDLVRREVAKASAGQLSQKQFVATKKLMLGERARGYQKLSNLVGFYDDYFTTGYEPFERFNELLGEIGYAEATAAFRQLFGAGTAWGLSVLGKIDQSGAAKIHAQVAPLWAQ